MAAFSLSWDTIMAAVTSCENTLCHVERICIDEAMKFSLGTSDINLKPRDGGLESCCAAK